LKNLADCEGWLCSAVSCPLSQLGGFAVAKAGEALTVIIVATIVATASSNIARRNKAVPTVPSRINFLLSVCWFVVRQSLLFSR
jgi:hypothetical protein